MASVAGFGLGREEKVLALTMLMSLALASDGQVFTLALVMQALKKMFMSWPCLRMARTPWPC